MKNKLIGGAGLLIALVALIAVNIFTNTSFTGARFDLTANGAYTLADGTSRIIERIDEPVTLRLFLSERLARETPSVAPYANRVRDVLLEYQRRSGGMIRLEFVDPEPFSPDEDRAVGYGLHAIPLGDEGTNFYFGLVGTNSTDDEVVVPYLNMEREAFLEYDLTKVLWQLLDTRTPVAGLLSSLPITGAPPSPSMVMRQPGMPKWMIMEQAEQTFEIRELSSSVDAIPDDVDMLMVVHPKGLPDATLYAIDQFVMRGGRLLMFVDPFAETDQPNPMMGAMATRVSRASTPERLFNAWGIEFDNGKFVADLQLALTVRFQREGKLMNLQYPAWIDVPQQYLNEDDPVTARVGKLVFGSAGAVALKEGSTLAMSVLARTSAQAALMDTALLDPMRDPGDILRDYQPGDAARVLAARFTGTLSSAFPDGRPAAGEADTGHTEAAGKQPAAPDGDAAADTEPAPHLAQTTEPANLIVVADTDMLEDRFWVQVQELLGSRLAVPTAGNGDFAINAMDNMSGSSDLISVRSRGRFARPFDRVNEIRREAELKFREKESQLTEQLNETEAKLVELESAKPSAGESLVLSEAQRDEIERFRLEKVRIRKELRDVLHERRRNIEDLEFRLRLVNIGLMPLLIVVAGVLVAAWQVQRRRAGALTARRS